MAKFVSSLAKLLKASGVRANAMKIDPYLNCDAGTLNPFEHGEVFVTRDGFECDLDVGNYERFLNVFARREQNLMMGNAYRSVLEKERRGEFLGKTMQLIPHVTNEVKHRIREAARVTNAEVLVVEIGGTVGDIESEVVLEAIRQMRFEEPANSTVFAHLALVPTIWTGEQKTKPMQHSVRALLARGISPDLIVCRTPEKRLSEAAREKIALFCNVSRENVFASPQLDEVYALPFSLHEQGLDAAVRRKLGLAKREPDLRDWLSLLEKARTAKREVRVAVVGKYAAMRDTYTSVFEALKHAGVANGVRSPGVLIDSEAIERGEIDLRGFDAIIVPGGFGTRGTNGIISAIRFARENNIPFLGLCYGLQLAVVEFARNVLGWRDANTTENVPHTKHPVIDLLPEQKKIKDKGGTMRLGAKPIILKKGTLVYSLYGKTMVLKRFRHRYEVNPKYVKVFEKHGLVFSGRDPKRAIMKVMELPACTYFVSTQAHPEFDSRLEAPEPLFVGLVAAAKKRAEHAERAKKK
ncbi:MAG: CTP synthase [Candidatus Norongarragalinales archaeon]